MEKYLLDEGVSECVIELLGMLILLPSFPMSRDYFRQQNASLIVSIGLNLLKTTTTEFELIRTQPEEFVNLALDTCDKQESETVKTQAAKLLEVMCDQVDDSITFLVTFCT